MSIIHSVGAVQFKNRDGKKTGVIDVCRDEDGLVHVRVNRMGEEIVLKIRSEAALKIADLFTRAAASGEQDS
jgi:hypothetical protein